MATLPSQPPAPADVAGPDAAGPVRRITVEGPGGCGAVTAIESWAPRGRAIIVMNPAEQPLIMRETVRCLTDHLDEATRTAGGQEDTITDVALDLAAAAGR